MSMIIAGIPFFVIVRRDWTIKLTITSTVFLYSEEAPKSFLTDKSVFLIVRSVS